MVYDHEVRFPLNWGESISIFFFGDLQTGAAGFEREVWEEFKREFKTTKNAHVIGVGDYSDFLRPTMQAKLYGALAHDDSARHE
jgi:hypothetical protein